MNFIGFEEEFQDRSRKPRKGGRPAINKKTKLNIVFDPEARRRFLTGFRKRKQERKEKYQEKLAKELAEEKLRMREEAKKSVAKKQSSSHSILPEVQHLLEDDEDTSEEEELTETYNIGSTIVSISSLDESIHSTHPSRLKKESDYEDSDNEGTGFLTYKRPNHTDSPSVDNKDSIKMKTLKQVLKRPLQIAAAAKTKTLVKKEAHRLLKHSDVYKKALKYKQQHSKKFRLNRYQPGARGGGGGTPSSSSGSGSKSKNNSKSCKGKPNNKSKNNRVG